MAHRSACQKTVMPPAFCGAVHFRRVFAVRQGAPYVFASVMYANGAPERTVCFIAIHRKFQTRRVAEDSTRLYGEATQH
ncbi:MAG: hypothetical protein ACFN9G_02450, partial [Cardiobacterium sp.]